MRPSYEAIDRYLEGNLDYAVQETAELCAIPSVSARDDGLEQCADGVVDLFRRHGYDVQKLPTPGAPVVVARLAGESERTLLFYNHYDVQPPEPLELWNTPPFAPTLRDGALYARGSKDDKGELVARIAAVDAVKAAHGGRLPCGVLFVVEGQEEIGSPHIAEFVQQHKDILRCHGAIWEEGGIIPGNHLMNMIGRRGILAVEMSVETMNRDVHSGGGHFAPSAAWRLIWALESLKGPDERIQIAGFYDDARPPTEHELSLLDALPDQEAMYRDLYGIKEFASGLSGKAISRAVFNPTCNVQGITTGYQGEGSKTIVPARASAKLDFRLAPDMNPKDIFAKLRAHLDAQGFGDVQIEWLGAMWPAQTDPRDPLVELTVRTAEEVYGVPGLVNPLNGGSSPQYAFMQPLGGIPVVSAGVGYWDSRTHAPNEHVRLVDFLNAARHIARILDRFAELPGRG